MTNNYFPDLKRKEKRMPYHVVGKEQVTIDEALRPNVYYLRSY